jgi:hypothetical protein
MKNIILCLFILIALSIFCIEFVNASVNEIHPTPQTFAIIQTTRIPSDFNVSYEPDSGVEIQNVTTFLIYWNERMRWGLSEKQISEYSIQAENQILKNLTKDGSWFHIKNLTRFDEEMGTIIGLSDSQISEFIIEDRK